MRWLVFVCTMELRFAAFPLLWSIFKKALGEIGFKSLFFEPADCFGITAGHGVLQAIENQNQSDGIKQRLIAPKVENDRQQPPKERRALCRGIVNKGWRGIVEFRTGGSAIFPLSFVYQYFFSGTRQADTTETLLGDANYLLGPLSNTAEFTVLNVQYKMNVRSQRKVATVCDLDQSSGRKRFELQGLQKHIRVDCFANFYRRTLFTFIQSGNTKHWNRRWPSNI